VVRKQVHEVAEASIRNASGSSPLPVIEKRFETFLELVNDTCRRLGIESLWLKC
jgi:hypothetical protein